MCDGVALANRLSTFQVFDAQDEVLRYDYRQKQKATNRASCEDA